MVWSHARVARGGKALGPDRTRSSALGVFFLLLLYSPTSPQEDPDAELAAVLEKMEARVADLKDFRASFSVIYDYEARRTKERIVHPFSKGSFGFASSGEARWTSAPARERGQFWTDWIDREAGVLASLAPEEFLLYVPWELHDPDDFAGTDGKAHYGASYYRADVRKHTPAVFPILTRPSVYHPTILLLDLAPRKYLASLPSLKVARRHREGGRSYVILTTSPVDPRDEARVYESLRSSEETWMGGEIWVDEERHWIARVTLGYENCYASPRHRYTHTFIFSRRGRFGEVDGIPTVITIGTSRLEFSDVRVNTGLDRSKLKVVIPSEAIVRDWVPQPASGYEARLKETPDDATAWFNLAAHRFRQQDWEGAYVAFGKVIELRPEAPEGYIGMSYLLKKSKIARRATKAMEGLRGAATKSSLVHYALADRYAEDSQLEKSTLHFEELLKLVGEEPWILVEMLRSTHPREDARRELFLRIYRAELAQGSPSYSLDSWRGATRQDRLRLVSLYERAVEKGTRQDWVDVRLLDLYEALNRWGDARAQARKILLSLKAGKAKTGFTAGARIFKFFLDRKDDASAREVQRAFASRKDESARRQAILLEADWLAIRGTPKELQAYVDTHVRPEWTPYHKFTKSPAYYRLMKGLRREKRAGLLAQRLLDSFQVEANRHFYKDVVEVAIEKYYISHVEGTRLAVVLKERLNGKPAEAKDLLRVCHQLVFGKRWKEAVAKAREILARKTLVDSERQYAERLLGESLVGLKDYGQAVDAFRRALAIKEGVSPRARASLLGQLAGAHLAAGNVKDGVLSYGEAFGELEGVERAASRWKLHRKLLDGLGGQMTLRSSRAAFRREAEEAHAADPDSPGIALVLSAALERTSEPGAAAGRIEEILKKWASHPLLLQDLIRLRVATSEPKKALEARARFVSIGKERRYILSGERLDELSRLDQRIVRLLESTGDLETARAFLETLLLDPRDSGHYGRIKDLLVILRDEATLKKVHARLMAQARNDVERYNFRWPAAAAYHEWGETEKALAFYSDVVAGNGWDEDRIVYATRRIETWKKEDRARREFLASLRRALANAGETVDETVVLGKAFRGRGRILEIRWLDRKWRAELREGTDDALFHKLGALRDHLPADRLSHLEALKKLGPLKPEWDILAVRLSVRLGKSEEAVRGLKAVLKKESKKARFSEKLGRLIVSVAWQLSDAQEKDLALELVRAGAYRWAWELGDAFLENHEVRLKFAVRWQRAAVPGKDRALARLRVAQTLLTLGREEEALGAVMAALKEPQIDPLVLRELESARIPLLARLGSVGDLAGALLLEMRRDGLDSGNVDRWSWKIWNLKGERLAGFIKAWDLVVVREKPSATLALFRARLERRAAGEEEALELFKKAADTFPKDPWIHRELGDLLFAKEEYKEAAGAFEVALREGDKRISEWILRSNLARCYAASGNPERAVDELQSIESPSRRPALARLAADLELLAEAIRLYTRVLSDDPRNDSARVEFAIVLEKTGRRKEAQAQYEILLGREEGVQLANARRLFSVLSKNGRVRETAELLKKTTTRLEDMPKALRQLDALLTAIPWASRAAVAEAWDERMEDLHPSPIVSIAGVRLASARRRNSKSVVERVLAARRKFPRSAAVCLESIGHLVRERRWTEMGAAYDRLLSLDPDGKETGLSRLDLYMRALRDFRQAALPAKALRMGILALGQTGPSTRDAKVVRRGLATVLAVLGADLWVELKKLRPELEVPEGKTLDRIAAHVELLGDIDIQKREAASIALGRIGVAALPALVGLLDAGDLEARFQARHAILDILQE